MTDVPLILSAIEQGDARAASQLLPLVYDELRRLAAHKLAREQSGHTLQPTALVHEAYLRLVGKSADQGFSGRGHFFAAAARAMRRILSARTADRYWVYARAWLRREMDGSGPNEKIERIPDARDDVPSH
jgi:ECF sigma factor